MMILKKNIAAGKINFIVFFLYFVLIFLQFTLKAEEQLSTPIKAETMGNNNNKNVGNFE